MCYSISEIAVGNWRKWILCNRRADAGWRHRSPDYLWSLTTWSEIITWCFTNIRNKHFVDYHWAVVASHVRSQLWEWRNFEIQLRMAKGELKQECSANLVVRWLKISGCRGSEEVQAGSWAAGTASVRPTSGVLYFCLCCRALGSLTLYSEWLE